MSKRTVEAAMVTLVAGWLIPGASLAAGYDPYAAVPSGPIEVDVSALVRAPQLPAPQQQPDLHALGDGSAPAAAPGEPGKLPAGWVQIGEVVQREEIAMGLKAIDPEPSAAWEDLEGNQYPRKHTLYINFNGGKLLPGEDNSALDKSTLARSGKVFPTYGKSEASALAIIQAVQEDMATFGVRIVYAERPSPVVPYTMAMVGGSWTDVNIDSPAGGVAPGTDCEARGQRHVVYVFDNLSSTVGQEAAHAWGLDHTMGSDRIMSYQQGSNKHFGENCQDLCEEACQGKGTIGCRLVHEKYCGVDSEQQNDLAELHFIFGTSEPDTTPPTVEIAAPPDGTKLESGGSVVIKGAIHDDYGGVGWKLVVKRDGAVIYDVVDFDRMMAWNLAKLPDGVYEVTLEAEDHADHVVRDTITFTVGGIPGGSDSDTEDPPTTSDSDGGEGSGESGDPSGGSSGGGGGGSDETGSSPASDSGTAGEGKSDDGGCRISPATGGPLGLLAPLLGVGLAWRARRRRR